MTNIKIDDKKRHNIIIGTYKEFHLQSKTKQTRSATISKIIELIKKELK